MKNFFKPDDFKNEVGDICTTAKNQLSEYGKFNLDEPCKILAEIANAKLEKLIESCTIVYTKITLEGPMTGTCEQFKMPHHTHKARLAFIEPLLREPCKHEPIRTAPAYTYNPHLHIAGISNPSKSHCKHCGIELIATWNAK